MVKSLNKVTEWLDLSEISTNRWPGKIKVRCKQDRFICHMECDKSIVADVCNWLFSELDYSFASLVVEDLASEQLLTYIFYGGFGNGLIYISYRISNSTTTVPSISNLIHAVDWHEREIEDLFGLIFEGHPRLGDFVLHEEWPEGINPMRADFDPSNPYIHREVDPDWRPLRIVQSPGAFMMPIGPVYSDFAESAHFLLETVGEDVIRIIPRFFYKYRGIEKIAEGNAVEHVILLAERFSGTSAFAHSLALCKAVENISGIEVPPRAKALRIVLAELERLRHHIGAIAGICSSTAFAVATSQAGILEEELLRLSGMLTGHRYLFGLNILSGLSIDLADDAIGMLAKNLRGLMVELNKLKKMLYFSSSFLDRLEEVGAVSLEDAVSHGLVGPVARASGLLRDIRKVLPYSGYEKLDFTVPGEEEGDGYARLRVLFAEAEQSVNIINQVASSLPPGSVNAKSFRIAPGEALGWVEAPRGASFHWIRVGEDGRVLRYRLTTPSFSNWHGFHLAAENFAFQDFPIIMATFGLSNAESDR